MRRFLFYLVGRRLAVTIAASAMTAVGGGRAWAEPARPPPAKPQGMTAAELHRMGNAAADAGRMEDALKHWQAAWDQRPGNGSLACDIGRVWIIKRAHVTAAEWLNRCVNLLTSADTPKEFRSRRNAVVDLGVARARVVTLHIDTEPGASLTIDGTPKGSAPTPEPIFLEPGEHRIEARKGPRSAVATLSAKAGETHRISLTLAPAEPPPLKNPSRPLARLLYSLAPASLLLSFGGRSSSAGRSPSPG